MKKQILLSFLLLFYFSSIQAQNPQKQSLTIKGQVIDEKGLPVSGALVNAYPEFGLIGKLPTATSDLRGEFSVVVGQTGNFKVVASKYVDGYPSTWNPFYHPTEEFITTVLVNENGVEPFAVVKIGKKAGKVTGKILDSETKQPIQNAEINLCRFESPKYCVRIPKFGSDGKFHFLAPTAPFTIRVSADGYRDWNGSGQANSPPTVFNINQDTIKTLDVSLEKSVFEEKAKQQILLPAPRIISPIDGTQFYHFPRKTKLEWAAVSGAVSYTVELEYCQSKKVTEYFCPGYLFQLRGNPPLSGIEGTGYEFNFLGAQPGRWRVWAVDEKGISGAKSDWTMFFYKN